MFTRVLGLILVLASAYFAGSAIQRHRGSSIVYLQDAAGLLFGTCCITASYRRKWLGVITGAGCLLCLIGADVEKWSQGLQPLRDVIIPWAIIVPVVWLVLIIIIRKRGKRDAA